MQKFCHFASKIIYKWPNIKEEFEKEPVKLIEKIIGTDLPDDIVLKIIDGVKANLTVNSVSKVVGILKGGFK